MKILRNELKNELNIRTQQNYPRDGVEFIDIMPLFIQKEVFKEIVQRFTKEISGKDVDYIVGPEARGLMLGAAIANEMNLGFVPARKEGKLPPITIESQVSYEKEYGKDVLELPRLVSEQYTGKNFYIVDDIYATGNTIKALKEAIKKSGGNVVGEGVIMNIKELNKNDEIFSLIDVNEN